MLFEEIALDRFEGFNQLLRKTKSVTPKIVSLHLKELETAGLITKKMILRNNCRVTNYTVTAKGREFHEIIRHMKKWNMKWKTAPSYCLSTPCSECPLFCKRR